MCCATAATDALAARAAKRAEALGYRNVHVLAGGTAAWQRAGFTLYAGVNVPSKTFGELIEHARHTPRVSALDVEAMRRAGENFVIVDGRPFAEYRKMSIPGGICCPNGELALRIGEIAPDPKTKIVVNCAGRTRSIIGAQTLIDFGVPNPVVALENGTQGWTLAGLTLENGAGRRHGDGVGAADLAARKLRARALAERHGVAFVTAADAKAWLADPKRTTYLLDVRTAEEFAANAVPGFAHAPGGQLVQATDQWAGVKGARLVLIDEEGVRAPVIAGWLRQLGHEASVLQGGVAAAAAVAWPQRTIASAARRAGGDGARGARRRAAPGCRAGHRPAPGHDLPRGSHRAGPLVDPAADRAGCRGRFQDRRARRRRARHRGVWRRSISPSTDAVISACWKAGTRLGARLVSPSSPRPTTRPMPDASISCSSPTAATRATRKPRASTSPGKPASSPSSTPRSAAPSASEGPARQRSLPTPHVARQTPREIGAWRIQFRVPP